MKRIFLFITILFALSAQAQFVALIQNSLGEVAPITEETPVVSNFRIENANPDRVLFDASASIEGMTSTGFTIFDKTIDTSVDGDGLVIDGDNLGGYFVVTSPFTFWDNSLIKLTSGDGAVVDFTNEVITNNINEPTASVDRYVTASASGGGDGTNDTTQAWTLAEGIDQAASGQTVWIKAGNYTVSSAILKFNEDGTPTAPIKFVGYTSTTGDITTPLIDGFTYTGTASATALKNASVYPVIDMGAVNEAIRFRQCNNLIFKNLCFTGGVRGFMIQGSGSPGTGDGENAYLYNVVSGATGNQGYAFTVYPNYPFNNIRIDKSIFHDGEGSTFTWNGDNNHVINSMFASDEGVGGYNADYQYICNGGDNVAVSGCKVVEIGGVKGSQGLSHKTTEDAGTASSGLGYGTNLVFNDNVIENTGVGITVTAIWTENVVGKRNRIYGVLGGLAPRDGVENVVFEQNYLENTGSATTPYLTTEPAAEPGGVIPTFAVSNVTFRNNIVNGYTDIIRTYNNNSGHTANFVGLNYYNNTFYNGTGVQFFNNTATAGTINVENVTFKNNIVDTASGTWDSGFLGAGVTEEYNSYNAITSSGYSLPSGTGNEAQGPSFNNTNEGGFVPTTAFTNIDAPRLADALIDEGGNKRSNPTTRGAKLHADEAVGYYLPYISDYAVDAESYLPTYNSGDSTHQIISSDSDWSTYINDPNKHHFFVQPGDYSASFKTLSASGTSGARRTIQLYNGDNIHPAQKTINSTNLAKVGFLITGDYWVIDRMAYWNRPADAIEIIQIQGGENNIINRYFQSDVGGACVTVYTGSHSNTIQNCYVQRTSLLLSGNIQFDRAAFQLMDEAGTGLSAINNVFCQNETYNYNDGFQAIRQFSTYDNTLNYEGTIVDCNAFWIDSTMYTNSDGSSNPSGTYADAENAIDIKCGSNNPANPMIITNNYGAGFRQSTPANSPPLGDFGTAMSIHFAVKNVVVENNFLYDSNWGITTAKGTTYDFATDDVIVRNNILSNIREKSLELYDDLNMLLEDNLFYNIGTASTGYSMKFRDFSSIPGFGYEWKENRVFTDGSSLGVDGDLASVTPRTNNEYYGASAISSDLSDASNITHGSDPTANYRALKVIVNRFSATPTTLAFPALVDLTRGFVPYATVDPTAPTMISATIENAAPTNVVMVFDEAVTMTDLVDNGFTLSGTTSSVFSSISGSGTTWTGVIGTAATGAETITISYSSATGDVEDSNGNPLGDISSQAVTNNISSVPAPDLYNATVSSPWNVTPVGSTFGTSGTMYFEFSTSDLTGANFMTLGVNLDGGNYVVVVMGSSVASIQPKTRYSYGSGTLGTLITGQDFTTTNKIAVTWSGTTLKTYLNGTLEATDTLNNSFATSIMDSIIFQRPDETANDEYSGSSVVCKLWSTELSQTQAETLTTQ